MRERATRILVGLVAVAAFAVFADNADRPLANPDEGRYSEISREMVATGDWVTPRLNGIKYFEKPPLQYWATALVFEGLGENEVTARIYVGLCGLATLLLAGFTARRLWGAPHALATMMVLAASPYFMALGGIVTLDMGLTLWTTLTLCAFLIAESPGTNPGARRRWLWTAWAAAALAVLSKGLVGAVFPAAAMFLYVVVRRDLSALRRLEWLPGFAIFLAIAAPWFVAVSLANSEFAQFFFVHEHFQRFLTTVHRRTEPWWYFLPIVFAGFLPWMLALPPALAHSWKRETGTQPFRPALFAMLWSAFIVVFFSASGSKLPAYILPAFPALALVLGRYLVEAPMRRLALMLVPMAPVAIALGWAAWRAPLRAREEWTRLLYEAAVPYGLMGAGILFAAALAGIFLMFRGRRMMAIVAVTLGTVLTIDCIEDAYEELSPRQSGRVVSDEMKPWLARQPRIYSVKHYEQTVPFYIGRTVTLVEYVDEFAPGLASEPGKDIPTVAGFVEDWLRPGGALAIMQPDLLKELRAQGLPMQVLHEDPRRVLVRKP